jgi:hypothetical protein
MVAALAAVKGMTQARANAHWQTVQPALPPQPRARTTRRQLEEFHLHSSARWPRRPAVEAHVQFLMWLVPAVEKFEKHRRHVGGRV